MNGGQSWSAVSSGLSCGSVTSMIVTPSSPSVAYFSCDGGGVFGSGVFKTTNAGQTWSAINNGLPSKGVTSLALDRGSPATLYAGTVGAGVFKSVDGGQTWQPTSSTRAIPTRILTQEIVM